MKGLLAWFVVGLTYNTRICYALLAQIGQRRVYQGTNVLLTMFDGFLLALVGVLLFLLPVVAIVFFPVTSLWLVVMNRREWHQIRDLAHNGRVQWGSGTIAEPPPAPTPEEPAEEKPDV